MRAVCTLENDGSVLFTMNTLGHAIRVDDLISYNGTTYKVESVVLKVGVIVDATMPLAVDDQGNVTSTETLLGKNQSRGPDGFAITLSAV